jgi:hypothetical protein
MSTSRGNEHVDRIKQSKAKHRKEANKKVQGEKRKRKRKKRKQSRCRRQTQNADTNTTNTM